VDKIKLCSNKCTGLVLKRTRPAPYLQPLSIIYIYEAFREEGIVYAIQTVLVLHSDEGQD
jgi:hypothetical protein